MPPHGAATTTNNFVVEPQLTAVGAETAVALAVQFDHQALNEFLRPTDSYTVELSVVTDSFVAQSSRTVGRTDADDIGAVLTPVANGLAPIVVYASSARNGTVAITKKMVFVAHVTDEVVEVLSAEQWADLRINRQLTTRAPTRTPSAANLEPGDVPGEGKRAPNEPSVRCGASSLCPE